MNFSTWIYAAIGLMIEKFVDKDVGKDLERTLEDIHSHLSFPKVTTYDFIVVGGGTAGSLIAGKLSEHFNVLLIEAGGSPPPASQSPTLDRFVDAHLSINNIFPSVPQFNFSQEFGGIVHSPTGRMLGGSGSHNANIYNRGSPEDYNRIADLLQDDSWRYENILKVFRSFENYVGTLLNEEEREQYYNTTHSDTNVIMINSSRPPMLHGWYEAGKELGYEAVDPNGFQRPGFTLVTKSVKNGERSSTYNEFVEPFEQSNGMLTVHRYSFAEEILIDPTLKKAFGVAYNRHGFPQIAHASKEVIVSCGTIQSPLLLMKSGLGPKDVLEEAGIPILNELPGVGKNLQNHVWIWLDFQMNKPNKTLLSQIRESDFLAEVAKYQEEERSGYFTGLQEGLQAFIPSSVAKGRGERDWADLQIIYIQELLPENPSVTPSLALIVDLNRPTSVGDIGLTTDAWKSGEREDTKLALIDWKCLSTESDVQAAIDGINFSLSIFENTTVFQGMEVEYRTDIPKACENITYRTDEYWKCYIRQRGQADLHMTGTCSMGANEDAAAVLDSEFRVRGVENLRVIDASSLPIVPNANINSAVMVTAAKGVDVILVKYPPPPPPQVDNASSTAKIAFGALCFIMSLIVLLN